MAAPAFRKADPVSRIQQYKKAWRQDTFLGSRQPNGTVGGGGAATQHSAAARSVEAVRARMRQPPAAVAALRKTRPSLPSAYEAPTSKKRHDVRSKIRAQFAKAE